MKQNVELKNKQIDAIYIFQKNKSIPFKYRGGVAEWLRHSVSNLVGSTRVDSIPVADTTNHKPSANSAVHPSEVGKWVVEVTLRTQVIVPQAHINCIAAHMPSMRQQIILLACLFLIAFIQVQ